MKKIFSLVLVGLLMVVGAFSEVKFTGEKCRQYKVVYNENDGHYELTYGYSSEKERTLYMSTMIEDIQIVLITEMGNEYDGYKMDDISYCSAMRFDNTSYNEYLSTMLDLLLAAKSNEVKHYEDENVVYIFMD